MSNGSEPTDDSDGETRRQVLASAVGVAMAGAAGYLFGTGTAQAATVGTVGTDANPYERAFVDRIVFEDITDPSSPDDGEFWYNSSA